MPESTWTATGLLSLPAYQDHYYHYYTYYNYNYYTYHHYYIYYNHISPCLHRCSWFLSGGI